MTHLRVAKQSPPPSVRWKQGLPPSVRWKQGLPPSVRGRKASRGSRAAQQRRAAVAFSRSSDLRFVSMFACFIAGCGGESSSLVPVSGVVTLDGESLSGARVSFEPRRQGEEINVGPSSYGQTDEQGRFVLETLGGGKGAVPGQHDVILSTYQGSPDQEGVVLSKERVPKRYRQRGILTYTVSTAETEQAIIELVSR